jgi:CelD/BcsL family acetyltransferase involved in cellulose biosynthesis
MPATIEGRINPLALLRSTVPSALNGNVVETGEDYDVWRRSLGRTYRKELERSWRVFTRAADASFDRVTEPAEAREVMAKLERQQGERMRSVGNAYVLDDPDFSRFYQTLVTRGVLDGSVVVTALRAEGELVAALVGLRDRDSYIMVRISQAGARWANCSPGRLIIERTIAHLHAQGCRSFDFSIGNYDYKRRFDTVALPLVDHVEALGWRGLRAAARARIVGRLRKYPLLDGRLRALKARLTG